MDAKHQEEGMEPLLLLPGLMCDARIFESQLATFPCANIAADYGSIDALGGMAEAVLADAPPTFALLGHSMGARVALEVWRRASERVTRMALVSTGTHLPREGEAAGRFALRTIGRDAGHEALVDAWLPPMIGPAQADDAALYDRLRTMCIDAGLPRYEAQIAALLGRPEVDSLLPTIDVPTLVAVGFDDLWATPAQHAAIAASIPGARLVVIADAGHMLPAEKPDQLNAAIRQWLAAPTTRGEDT